MDVTNYINKFIDVLPPYVKNIVDSGRTVFECPVCEYVGSFDTMYSYAGKRTNAKCPKCKSLERHRLQVVVLKKLLESGRCPSRVLHFAPEKFIRGYLENRVESYITADINPKNVDFKVDMTNMQFDDDSFDLLYASHVLEHIKDDLIALEEVKRVVKLGGIAILAVPIVSKNTIEYDQPNPYEEFHWRAPALDYYDRCRNIFSKVEIYSSELIGDTNQPFIYENRTIFPNKYCPNREPMAGIRHSDYVAVCYK